MKRFPSKIERRLQVESIEFLATISKNIKWLFIPTHEDYTRYVCLLFFLHQSLSQKNLCLWLCICRRETPKNLSKIEWVLCDFWIIIYFVNFRIKCHNKWGLNVYTIKDLILKWICTLKINKVSESWLKITLKTKAFLLLQVHFQFKIMKTKVQPR